MRLLAGIAGGFMSWGDPSSGQGASTSAELRRQAQDSVRVLVASAGQHGRGDRRWVVPLAATAVVAAAACAPVVLPLLLAAGAGSAAAVVGAALTQVGGVGGGLLSEAVIRAWDRVRSRGQSDVGQAGLRDALAAELEAGLTLDTPAAAALRSEVAAVLRTVDAIQVALRATVEESAAGVREVLVRGLSELGEEFTEFRWVLDEVNEKLTGIYEDVAQMKAAGLEAADVYQQILVEVSVLRARCAVGSGALSRLILRSLPGRLWMRGARPRSTPPVSRLAKIAPTWGWQRSSQEMPNGFSAAGG